MESNQTPVARWAYFQDSRPRDGGVNEDATFCAPVHDGRLLMAAVADGVGGRPGGARAAQKAIQLTLRRAKSMLATVVLDHSPWRMALEAVHGELCRERGGGETALTVLITDGERWTAAWAGDSRLYRLRGGEVTLLTQPRWRTGYLGGERVDPQAISGTGEPGDRLVLLSDGIWKYVQADRFASHLSATPAQIMTRLLQEAGRLLSGRLVDDASGVVVVLGAPRESADPDAAPRA